MKEIQKYYDEKAIQMHVPEQQNQKKSGEERSDFKTMSIDY